MDLSSLPHPLGYSVTGLTSDPDDVFELTIKGKIRNPSTKVFRFIFPSPLASVKKCRPLGLQFGAEINPLIGSRNGTSGIVHRLVPYTIDLCISNGIVPHSCFDPDRIPLAIQSLIRSYLSLSVVAVTTSRLAAPVSDAKRGKSLLGSKSGG